MGFVLDFERPLVELEKKIAELKVYSSTENVDMDAEIHRLEQKALKLRKQIYSRLTRWQRVQLARHPQRAYTLDYIEYMTTDFIELHGDRAFADDPALVGGIAKLDGKPVVIFGQQKGRDVKQKIYRNFGMMHPEGYRKALRLMKLAAKYRRPVISLVDTPGAYPGIGAEERGQAEAIARNLLEMSRLPVPIIVVIIGEGASGGALGIGVGDRVMMQENTWYSVISPEGCAAILYRDASKAPQAAEAMKVTAPDLLKMGVIDRIIPEPAGGAHRNPQEAAALVKEAILEELPPLEKLPPEELVRLRIEKFARMGAWQEK
ncbi:MAG: acetyl-CoA carboxylase carboxyltransferase subunit alpha [bacterium]|jgi:acetyl-CoA carboxylase carboxyl transferase subunit alpha|nr:acetyl-CoA carboxylase carboxyltransferase subunit alpha [candidate division KSB1 bacterium]MDH7558755.1 acetyl-CoA carboxylase carboxyltransferase subunit alpha [bacterium]